MKLRLEINNNCYYLGQMHQRQCDKSFQRIKELITNTLTSKKIKYSSHQIGVKNVKSVLYISPAVKIKLLCNNDNYQVNSIDISQNSIRNEIPVLIEQAIKDE